jgi:hypothetical protein
MLKNMVENDRPQMPIQLDARAFGAGYKKLQAHTYKV